MMMTMMMILDDFGWEVQPIESQLGSNEDLSL